jgi:hypothetical protein
LCSAIVVFAFIAYSLNRAARIRAELGGDAGNQNRAATMRAAKRREEEAGNQNRAATMRAAKRREEEAGNQNKANCSPARAASMKSSTPVPLATVPTQSMNFASETTGTPNSRAR